MMGSRLLAWAIPLAVTLAAPSVFAQQAPPLSDGQPPPPPPPPTVLTAPPGSSGYTVVAPTPGGGSVTAVGCSQVIIDGRPSYVTATGQPCPYTMQPYYAPYPYYPGPPPSRYARDPDRTAALIASSIGFGLGALVAGTSYLVSYSSDSDKCSESGTSATCSHANARSSLIAYGAIVTLTPSIPRFVVGDVSGGLIFTALRAASVTSAVFIHWGNNSDTEWQGPFLLGFAVPITLGILDLALTPHREDLEEKKPPSTGVQSLGPVPLTDPHTHGTVGALMSLQGTF